MQEEFHTLGSAIDEVRSPLFTDDLSQLLASAAPRTTLLYRGSRDGFTAQSFHLRCDGRPHTICVIKDDQNNVFGGYTDVPWTSSGGSWKHSDVSFLFRLSSEGQRNVTKFTLRGTDNKDAVYHNSSYLCVFGGRHDIVISDNCNSNQISSCNIGKTYHNNGTPHILTGGRQRFQVAEIEVYQLDMSG